MGFPRQEYWSGLPFPSPGDLLNPWMESTFPALAGRFFIAEPPGKHYILYKHITLNSNECLRTNSQQSNVIETLERWGVGPID